MTAPDCVTCGATGELDGICPDCYGVGWVLVEDERDRARWN